MTSSDRQSILVAFTCLALAGMMVIVALSEAGVVGLSSSLAAQFPEFAARQPPLVAFALAFGVCVEVILVVTGILVFHILTNRIFHPSALRLVNALGVTMGVASLLIVAAIFQIPGPPALAAAMMAGAAFGGTILLVLLVLRSLLAQAVSLHEELDEVV